MPAVNPIRKTEYLSNKPESADIDTAISGSNTEKPFFFPYIKAKIISKNTFKTTEINLDKLTITGVLDNAIGKIKNSIIHSIINGINFFIIQPPVKLYQYYIVMINNQQDNF